MACHGRRQSSGTQGIGSLGPVLVRGASRDALDPMQAGVKERVAMQGSGVPIGQVRIVTTQREAEKTQAFHIRPLGQADGWVRRLLAERWGSTVIVTRGQIHAADELPGFAALRGSEPVGLVTYRMGNCECEIISLDSLAAGRGIGSALVRAVQAAAAAAGCRRVWLVTTNDNMPAIRFYQRRGFRLVAIHRDAVELSRRLKPEIPLIGLDGIPLCDEVELELTL